MMATASPPAFTLPLVARVNLMPRAETERRQTSALIRRWIGGLVATLVVVALLSAGALWLQLGAVQRLAAENARTESLLSDLAALADVRAKLDLQSELATFREEAMATDLTWTGLLRSVETALPAGVTVTGYQLAPGGVPVTEDPASELGAVGSIFLASDNPQGIVPLVRALRPLPGVLVAEAWQVTPTENAEAPTATYTYEVRIAFDQSVYTGAYDQEDAE